MQPGICDVCWRLCTLERDDSHWNQVVLNACTATNASTTPCPEEASTLAALRPMLGLIVQFTLVLT